MTQAPPAAEATASGSAAAHAAHPRDARPARAEHLVAHTGHPHARRPGRARGVPVQHDPGLQRGADRRCCPTLEDHACSLGRRGGFMTRLEEGTWLGHVAEHIAHRAAGPGGHRGSHRQDAQRGRDRPATTSSTSTARRKSAARRAGSPWPWSTTSSRPRGAVSISSRTWRTSSGSPRSEAFGPSTQAHHRRGRVARHPLDPTRPLEPRPARPGRPPAAHPGDDDLADTSAIAVDIASDKSLTNQLLSSAGLPVPQVADACAREDEAVRPRPRRSAIRCVVKPLDGNHGRGVSLDLRTEDDVRRAVPLALRREPQRRRGRGDVRDRQRLPRAGHRRQDRRRRPARAGQRRRATASTPCASWSTSRTPTRAAASATRRC